MFVYRSVLGMRREEEGPEIDAVFAKRSTVSFPKIPE